MKASWFTCLLVLCAIVLTSVVGIPAFAQSESAMVRHVAGRVPIIGAGREMAADRSPSAETTGVRSAGPVDPKANPWKLLATLPGAVVHDITFPSAKIGYAAAELGQVWKTVNGGTSWTRIMNLGFPYYWYGVTALTAKDVVISGFNDNNFEGILRWSHDGGKTWTGDVVLTTSGWSFRVRFADPTNGLVMDGLNLNAPNAAHVTTDGGAQASDWTENVPDPNGGWFGNQFSLHKNMHARASGITFCKSKNGGAKWSCRAPIDSVFDGPVFFQDDTYGWVGGGEISPNVEGWVHQTADGGKTWSGRTLDGPWPIREIRFLSPTIGWAAGGNYSQNIGGMYFSRNGGKTWSLDVNTGAEMDACDRRKVGTKFQIWCAGYNSSFNGVVYTLKNVGID
jgi:photosystem II stability/assembly factor-like uncharacterized protein